MTATPPAPPRGALARLGLDRPELRAWAMYDWAISAMQTVITTAIFPIFFSKVAAAGLPKPLATKAFSDANVIAFAIVALLSPFAGALADYLGIVKRLCFLSMLVGIAATAGMFWIGEGDLRLASWLYVLVIVGGTGSMVFYESLLPRIARVDEVDRVSSAGYAVGYIGGGLLLAASVAVVLKPALFGIPAGSGSLATRITFLMTAGWWLVFSWPLFRRVPEPPRLLEPGERRNAVDAVVAAGRRLAATLREIRHFKHAFLMLLAFLVYNDGIQTIIKMAGIFGEEIGLDTGVLISAILLVQFIGFPCTFAFGWLAGKLGAKRAVLLGLAVYALVSVVGYFMRTATHFVMLAVLVGLVQGGTQALSRSLFASMTPPHKSAEFFGFYSIFEKFANIFGQALFSLSIALSGSSRTAILSIIALFVAGAVLLLRVDVAAGQRAAREAEAGTARLGAAPA